MARELFVPKDFSRKHLHIINEARKILAEYAAAGFTMTLRQLHYQFVGRGVHLLGNIGEDSFPYPNTDKSYDMLGNVMNDARYAGLIDWNHMEDRIREEETLSAWTNPQAIMEAVAEQYRQRLWESQKWVPEVWIEKDALVGVIEGICREWRVTYLACRGYASASAHYKASKRFLQHLKAGRTPVLFYLGDHDPSGIDMGRDHEDKLSLLCGRPIEVVRLGLNMDQIEEHNPPPNPAKMSDVRAAKYVEEYGDESWELDALGPDVISELVNEAIGERINRKAWDYALGEEENNKSRLQMVSDRWDETVEYLENNEE